AELLVSAFFARLNNRLAPESHRAEVRLVAPNSPIHPHAAILPHAGNHIRVLRFDASNRFATGPHERVKRFNTVDAVKEHVRRALLIRTWSPGDGTGDGP